MNKDTVDLEALRAICTAIAATDAKPLDRVKSIAQVAHELLHTASITVYAWNRSIQQLEILAMPGVTRRELMRGPTDKLIFRWEEPHEDNDNSRRNDNGRHGVWLESEDEYKQYLDELAKRFRLQPDKISQGDFRTREIARKIKHSSEGQTTNLRMATAKIYLWKGLDQTNNRVGQAFFNFITGRKEPVFDTQMRRAVSFICYLLRELLIDHLYHRDLPSVQWTPERMLRELDSAFLSESSSGDSEAQRENIGERRVNGLEGRVSDILAEAAMGITENFAGHADVVFLIGRRLGRIISGTKKSSNYQAILIPDESILGTCVKDRRFFVGDQPQFIDVLSEHERDHQNKDKNDGRYLPEFAIDPALCLSLMVWPVADSQGIRAVIRVASPRPGRFLHAQAQVMQTLEQFARYALMRLDETRQREQMASALNFLTQLRGVGDTDVLTTGLLSAMGAVWGTFWWVGKDNNIVNGIHFSRKGVRDIPVDDSDYGVRDRGGFTRALIEENLRDVEPSFFALHVLPRSVRYPGGIDSPYYLQVFKKRDTFAGEEFQDGSDQGLRSLNLKPDTQSTMHSRIAFVVWDGTVLSGVLWLVFDRLREVSWWERDFLFGLSEALGGLVRLNAFRLAVSNFRHMMSSISDNAYSAVGNLLDEAMSNDRVELLSQIQSNLQVIKWKSTETKCLIDETGRDQLISAFGRRSLGDLIDRAIGAAISDYRDRTPWKKHYTHGVSETTQVSALYFSPMLNILSNVVDWGWREQPEEFLPLACIWAWQEEQRIYTCVGNNGWPQGQMPLIRNSPFPGEEHGIGLKAMKALLRQFGGDIYDATDRVSTYRDRPTEFAHCITFYEFYIPLS